MSSDINELDHQELFHWRDDLDPRDYLFATYTFETDLDAMTVACAIAREQSVVAAHHVDASGYNPAPFAARVRSLESTDSKNPPLLAPFQLHQDKRYALDRSGEASEFEVFRAEIAYPLSIIPATVTGIWSVVLGEIPRLGFLNAVRLIDIAMPDHFIEQFPGPRFGVDGIRQHLGIPRRPLFCRAARPAVGMSIEDMAAIGRNVLRGGFDVVKDDEMTLSGNPDDYRQRIQVLSSMAHQAAAETGEPKLYVANLIEDISLIENRIDILKQNNVECVLVAPALQGQSIVSELRSKSEFIIMAHNTVGDIMNRLDRFGVDLPVILKLHRLAGADIVFMSGDFATDNCEPSWMRRCIQACTGPMHNLKPSLPVIAGGKKAAHLDQYINSLGTTDFIIIAATTVDEHPDGTEQGAREFRDAWSKSRHNQL